MHRDTTFYRFRPRALLCALVAATIARGGGTLLGQSSNPKDHRPADVRCGQRSLIHFAPNPSPKDKARPLNEPLCPNEADTPARVRIAPLPAYPLMLRNAGVEGEVVVQFVFGEDGRVDTSSFRVLRSTHDQFTQAVRFAAGRWTGRAVVKGTRKFAQWVALDVQFQHECFGKNPAVFSADASLCVKPSSTR